MNYICQATAMAGFYTCADSSQPEISYATEMNFINHMAEFGLSYESMDDYKFRLGLFSKVDAEINKQNAIPDSFTMGHNEFSTYTDEEWDAMQGIELPSEEE